MSLIGILVVHTGFGVQVIADLQGGALCHEAHDGHARSSVQDQTVAGVMVADPVSLVAVLAAVYGIVLGVVVLVSGWRRFRVRTVDRSGRGVRVPLEGATGQVPGGAR